MPKTAQETAAILKKWAMSLLTWWLDNPAAILITGITYSWLTYNIIQHTAYPATYSLLSWIVLMLYAYCTGRRYHQAIETIQPDPTPLQRAASNNNHTATWLTWDEIESNEIEIDLPEVNDEICQDCELPSHGAIFITKPPDNDVVLHVLYKCEPCRKMWFARHLPPA